MAKYLTVLFCMLLSLPAFAADLTVTYQLKEGKKTKGEKTVYWSEQFQMTKDASTKIDLLSDYGKGTIYTINHGKKQIEVINYKEMTGMMGGAQQMMGEMLAQPGMKGDKTMGESLQKKADQFFGDPDKAVLQKLGTLTIAGRSCDNYKVERKGKKFEMSEEVCVDPTIVPPGKPTADMEAMQTAAQEMGGVLGNFQSAGQKELAQLKGLPLRRIDTSKAKVIFGGGKRLWDEEAITVQEGPIDPSVFTLPTGYKQIDQAKEMREQMEAAQQMMGGMGK